MLQRAAHLLRLSAAFQVVNESEVLELAALARFRTLPKGEMVFSQGEPASSLYLVETGLLRVSRLNAAGRELILMLGGLILLRCCGSCTLLVHAHLHVVF